MSHHEGLELKPLVTLPVVQGLLTVHVDIKHPVVRAKGILLRNPVPSHPGVRLVLPLGEVRCPLNGRSTAEVRGWPQLANFATVPVEVRITPTVGVGVRVRPVAMADTNRTPAPGSTAHEHI